MKFIKRNKWVLSCILTVVIFLSVLGLNVNYNLPDREFTITVGTIAEASGTVDYVCDGTDDNIQLQGALDALPANGGSIKILPAAVRIIPIEDLFSPNCNGIHSVKANFLIINFFSLIMYTF